MVPKVSIIVPVYNVGDYVEKCASTIFEQTLDDIEIIFVDDCTPDNSIELINKTLESYPHRVPQVKFLHHETNKGLPQSRYDGLMAATGTYVLNVDSDDFLSPHMAESLYTKAVETRSDVVICDYYRWVDEDNCKLMKIHEGPVAEGGKDLRDDTLNRIIGCFVWIRLIKRDLLCDTRILWPKYSMHEDAVISSSVMALAQHIAYLQEPLYYYRYNPTSIQHKKTEEAAKNRFIQSVENMHTLCSFLERQGLAEVYHQGIINGEFETLMLFFPYTGRLSNRILWHKAFPNCGYIMLHGRSPYYKRFSRTQYALTLLGLYGPYFKRALSRNSKSKVKGNSCQS